MTGDGAAGLVVVVDVAVGTGAGVVSAEGEEVSDANAAAAGLNEESVNNGLLRVNAIGAEMRRPRLRSGVAKDPVVPLSARSAMILVT